MVLMVGGEGTCAHAHARVRTHTVTHTHMQSHSCTHVHVVYTHTHVYKPHSSIYTRAYASHKCTQVHPDGKEPACNAEDPGSIPGCWVGSTCRVDAGGAAVDGGGGAPASDHRTWGIKGCQVQDAGLCIPLFRPQLDPTQADGVAMAQVSGGAGGPGLARMHRHLRHPQRPGTVGIGPIEAWPPEHRASPCPVLPNSQQCLMKTSHLSPLHTLLSSSWGTPLPSARKLPPGSLPESPLGCHRVLPAGPACITI